MASRNRKNRNDDLAVRLSRRLKQLREQRGWTQVDVSRMMGVRRTSVANYEQGVSFPSVPALDKLARIFGVTIDSLIHGAESPQQIIRDRDLLEMFRRLDALDYRIKSAMMAVFEAVVFQAEEQQRARRRS